MNHSPVPVPAVAAAFAQMPADLRACVEQLRDLVYDVAQEQGLTELTETLKWGQPAYLPGRQGTTLRLSCDAQTETCKILVHCQTSLVEDWRNRFADRLHFEGNRAIVIDPKRAIDRAALAQCVADTFTYHQARR